MTALLGLATASAATPTPAPSLLAELADVVFYSNGTAR